MKILIYGASGMVGGAALKEALDAEDVTEVQVIGRSPMMSWHHKMSVKVQPDLLHYGATDALDGFDACFFCLGSSAMGSTEEEYRRINYEIPMAAGRAIAQANPATTFIYVSGAGTGTQKAMWSRVKRQTETDLLGLPFENACMFRPGVIQPVRGARSKTGWYRVIYTLASPVLSIMRYLLPTQILTSAELGQAMLQVARTGVTEPTLESRDIRSLISG